MVPPDGPAMPVTATATLARLWFNAPSAIALATGADTAPNLRIRSGGTSSMSDLASLEYVTKPRSTYFEDPASSVRAAMIKPPVQDSAAVISQPRTRSFSKISGTRESIYPPVKHRLRQKSLRQDRQP